MSTEELISFLIKAHKLIDGIEKIELKMTCVAKIENISASYIRSSTLYIERPLVKRLSRKFAALVLHSSTLAGTITTHKIVSMPDRIRERF